MAEFNIVGDDRCEYLCWKGLYVDAPKVSTTQEGDHVYWCLKTQINLGPDGKVVDQYECNPARGCYSAL